MGTELESVARKQISELVSKIYKAHDAADEALGDFLYLAKEAGDRINELYRMVGGYKNRGATLTKYIPKIKQRKAQVYVQIAERWDELQPKIIEGKIISIRGALKELNPPKGIKKSKAQHAAFMNVSGVEKDAPKVESGEEAQQKRSTAAFSKPVEPEVDNDDYEDDEDEVGSKPDVYTPPQQEVTPMPVAVQVRLPRVDDEGECSECRKYVTMITQLRNQISVLGRSKEIAEANARGAEAKAKRISELEAQVRELKGTKNLVEFLSATNKLESAQAEANSWIRNGRKLFEDD